MKKHVVIQVSKMPNLLQASLVALQIGGFEDIVKPQDKDDIMQCVTEQDLTHFRRDFRKLPGVSSSTWFALFYQIPAYLADDNIDSLQVVFDELAIQHPLHVVNQFPEKRRMIQKYMSDEEFNRYVGYEKKPPSPWPDLLGRFADVVSKIHDCWLGDKWKSISQDMTLVREELLPAFEEHDWIGEWEDATNIEFPYPEFIVELIDPVTTQGTSLLAERDGFYAYAEPLKIITMISHEICTHLFYNSTAISHPVVGSLIQEDLERYLRANELLSWTLNEKVMQKLGFKWVMSDSFQWIGKARDMVRTSINDLNGECGWGMIELAYSKVPSSQ